MRAASLFLLLAACGSDPAPSDLTFTGGYEDWDTATVFLGIGGATVTHVDSGATATTAPNGRSTLDLTAATLSDVTFTAPGYLPARYTLDPATHLGPYLVLGISTARLDGFHADLGLTHDPSRALVELSVTTAAGDPVDGVSIAVGGATGGVHQDATGTWLPGATTAGSPFVVYPNVPITGGGEVTLSVLAPVTCHHPATLHIAAGELAMTSIFCD